MANRFVRSSKYRHVFGRSTKKEQCYDNLRISKNAWDSNIVKANPSYISVNWESSGGGAFAVIPVNERGRLPDMIPLFRGHTAAVLDTDWNPFDDSLLASGSDDGKVFIWKVPDGFSVYTDGEEPADVSPVAKLTGHSRKVGHVLFNPSANNVLASSSGDYSIKLWDVESGASKLALKHSDIVQSMSWNAPGSLLVTTCRDKKLRVWDVRQEKPAQEVQGHTGAKNSRAVWMGEHDRIATTGFSRMSDRQLGLWDPRAPNEPLGGFQLLDSISGVCMPFWDDGTNCLYLAGKGDGNIRYYEYENDAFVYLSEYKSTDPQRGIAFLPKRGINVHENEVMRCFKTVADTYVEPISFIVPRRAEVFQSDIYPPTVGTKPAISAGEWFAGKDGVPSKISLEAIYDGSAPVEIPSDYKPPAKTTAAQPPAAAAVSSSSTAAPSSAKSAVSPTSPLGTFAQRPAGSLETNKASMAAMASKFADKDAAEDSPDDDDDDASSFEEVPKPAERHAPSPNVAARMEAKVASAPHPTSPGAEKKATATTPAPAPAATTPSQADSSRPAPTPASAAEGIRSALADVRAALEAQTRTLAAQAEQMAALARDVAALKAAQGQGGGAGGVSQREREMGERIRELELELEEARS